MKALSSNNDVPFKGHDNLQDYLNDSPLNCKLYDFIISMGQRYGISFQILDIFSNAYKLCHEAITHPCASTELTQLLLSKTGYNELRLLPYIIAWYILSSYKRLPYAAEIFAKHLYEVIKRSTLYSLAKEQINLNDFKHLSKMDDSGSNNTENTFQQFNIQHVENLNPNATTVINNYYGKREGPIKCNEQKPETTEAKSSNGVQTNKQSAEGNMLIRTEILQYISRLKLIIADDWKQGFDKLWNNILDLTEVSSQIYNPGKQQKTNFNRNLVANIIHYLGSKGMIKDYNASKIAELLEGDKEHSVRSSLGKDPNDDILAAILNIQKN